MSAIAPPLPSRHGRPREERRALRSGLSQPDSSFLPLSAHHKQRVRSDAFSSSLAGPALSHSPCDSAPGSSAVLVQEISLEVWLCGSGRGFSCRQSSRHRGAEPDRTAVSARSKGQEAAAPWEPSTLYLRAPPAGTPVHSFTAGPVEQSAQTGSKRQMGKHTGNYTHTRGSITLTLITFLSLSHCGSVIRGFLCSWDFQQKSTWTNVIQP